MTATHAADAPPAPALIGWLTPLAIFSSAALVFLVEPLVARLLLPSLGGAPAVWNTCLVFFQAALLLGYVYAHALQRVRSVRVQGAIHVALLIAAALTLPLRLTDLLGEPPTGTPTLWLLGVLVITLGAPFAVLSATAPLLQAWWAAAYGGRRDPYPLYAASNLGSLAALLAYPLVVEPLAPLDDQRWLWSIGYGLFAALLAALALSLPKARAVAAEKDAAPSIRWSQRLWWVFLAAVPSSLLLGVTQHISTDVASAPFLWVVPLALYLLTFVLAFRERPLVPTPVLLLLQGFAVPVCLTILWFSGGWAVLLPVHLATFVLTAWMCHQRLADGRPAASRLTEFYLALSIGGVLGGAFNALLAPLIFDRVWEYPAVLVLAALARPVVGRRFAPAVLAVVAVGLAAAALGYFGFAQLPRWAATAALTVTAVCAFLLRDRGPAVIVLLAALMLAGPRIGQGLGEEASARSFFGVYTVTRNSLPGGLGAATILRHGTTMHGAQLEGAGVRCQALTYYAEGSPMQGAVAAAQAKGPVRVGVVGLGAGSLAAYVRPQDSIRIFEIDPLMVELARTRFSYLDVCASGRADVVVGDARLTVAREPGGSYDVLIIDAFSSDAVPAHLMTVEGMRGWLRALKPDGVVVVHISNRNLDLEAPVVAALQAAGARDIARNLHSAPEGVSSVQHATSHVVAASPSAGGLDALRAADPAWRNSREPALRPWTDDRTDVLGALLRDAGGDFRRSWLGKRLLE